jgi:D-threo-aldose 1-dehydrogenase
MQKSRAFGQTGLMIPPIVFGTSALGNLYTELPYITKKEIISECFQHSDGTVVFDSAGKYGAGLALEMMGKIFHELEILPQDVLISNKLGWKRVPLTTKEPTFERGVWMGLQHDAVQCISYEGIMECFEQGNNMLGQGYVPQMVSVHDPDEYLGQARNAKEEEKYFSDILDAYRALNELKKNGRIKVVGIGAKNWKIIQRIEKETELDWVMIANSMTVLNHPPELLSFMDYLYLKGIGIINSAVFHAGFLIGGDYFDYQLIRPGPERNTFLFRWRENFHDICTRHGVKPAVACVQFGFTAPGVAAVSLNTSNPKWVKENIDSVNANIPGGFWDEMKKKGLISNEYPYI